MIAVRASVEVPVVVSTPYLYFAGLSDSAITKTVEIGSRDEHPIRVEPVSFDLPDKVVFRIEEVKPGREFHVHLSTIPGRAGTYLGTLVLKTNHPRKPTVTIRIRGRIKKAPAGDGAGSPGKGGG